MSTNGKGSKRRPETEPGTFVRNWDEINWSKRRERPTFNKQMEAEAKSPFSQGDGDGDYFVWTKEAQPFPEPPE